MIMIKEITMGGFTIPPITPTVTHGWLVNSVFFPSEMAVIVKDVKDLD